MSETCDLKDAVVTESSWVRLGYNGGAPRVLTAFVHLFSPLLLALGCFLPVGSALHIGYKREGERRKLWRYERPARKEG